MTLRSSTRQLSVVGLALTLAVSLVLKLPPAKAAAAETCFGRVATLFGTAGDDILIGTPGPDVIVARGGADEIDALGGDDIVCGGDGDDLVMGGDGDDRIRGEDGNDVIFGGPGRDRLSGGRGDDELRGMAGADLLVGNRGKDLLFGGADGDRIYGGPGNDVVRGGPGNDSVRGGSGNDDLKVGAGSDDVRGGAGDDAIAGGAGSDTLRGGSGDDVIDGNGAADQIFGGADRDDIEGGGGDDVIRAGPGDDIVHGDCRDKAGAAAAECAGRDLVYGGIGFDDLHDHARVFADDRVDGGPDFDACHPESALRVRCETYRGFRGSGQAKSTAAEWRPIVTEIFTDWGISEEIEHAMQIIACESLGDPFVVTPPTYVAGIFQHHPDFWTERTAKAGIPGRSIFDPEAQAIVAAWLVRDGGGWSHWHCLLVLRDELGIWE